MTTQIKNKQNLAEDSATRHDPNNHENKVYQLPGTVRRSVEIGWNMKNVRFAIDSPL